MTTVAFRRPVFQDQVRRVTRRLARKIALTVKIMGYARAAGALANQGQYEAAENLFREKMNLKKELQND
jgi:hypothetical protein